MHMEVQFSSKGHQAVINTCSSMRYLHNKVALCKHVSVFIVTTGQRSIFNYEESQYEGVCLVSPE